MDSRTPTAATGAWTEKRPSPAHPMFSPMTGFPRAIAWRCILLLGGDCADGPGGTGSDRGEQ